MSETLETPSSADLAIADRFIECCYNDDLRRPTAQQMARLVTLGLVEVVKPGAYGETALLRQALATHATSSSSRNRRRFVQHIGHKPKETFQKPLQ